MIDEANDSPKSNIKTKSIIIPFVTPIMTSNSRSVYIPTADEVNRHTLLPVDKIEPYDYLKHIPNNMQRKLEQRRDQISSEVAHTIEESFGFEPRALERNATVPSGSTTQASHPIPRPPSTNNVHSPIVLRPSTARNHSTSPRSLNIRTPRPRSSPSHRQSNASTQQIEDGPLPTLSGSIALSSNRRTSAAESSIIIPSTSVADCTISRPNGRLLVANNNTLPSEAEVQAAMALLRERSNASPNGIPFLIGGSSPSHHRRPTPVTSSASKNTADNLSETKITADADAKGSWAGVASASPSPRPYTGVQRIITANKAGADQSNALPTTNMTQVSFGGAGLGAGVGLYNPSDVTSSWMIAGDNRNGSISPRARQTQSKPTNTEPLATPKAPLLRRSCSKTANTYASTPAALARRAQGQAMRQVEVDKELERIAAATVRMQADHEHRKAIRQRRYLQGLAIKQPYEVSHFAKVVRDSWRDVEQQREFGVLDDIPAQVLQQQRESGAIGNTQDNYEQLSLVARAVHSARGIRFEREIRAPQDQYTPRRNLM